MELRIEVRHDAPHEDVRMVDEGLDAFTVEHGRTDEVQRLAVLLRDADGRVAGGAVGRTWGACSEVQLFWVREDLRGRGFGRRLLETIEREAAARGCTLIYLETFSFQAPELYPRLGYREVRVIRGFPRGIAKHFFEKDLAPPS